jgi:hypothetical protein
MLLSFRPSSVQFKGEINGAFPCKRHQKQHLEFLNGYLRIRGPGVQVSPGAPLQSGPHVAAPEVRLSARASPKPSHAITFKRSFIADDWYILSLSLSNKHTVKWVLVRTRQKSGPNPMLCRDGK